jgi:hypothetical protein
VFEFEASQDGHPEVAQMFRELRNAEGDQIAALMSSLQRRLGALDALSLGE